MSREGRARAAERNDENKRLRTEVIKSKRVMQDYVTRKWLAWRRELRARGVVPSLAEDLAICRVFGKEYDMGAR